MGSNIAYKRAFRVYPRSQCLIIVEIILKSEIVDYILTICVVWLIMIGFFLILTLEVMIVIGVIFPVLIIMLLNRCSRSSIN